MSGLLAHDHVAGTSGRDVVVFAHGILGSRGNWKSFAKKLNERSGWSTLCVDLRNHGQSHGFAPPHTVQAAADDVTALCAALDLRPRVVVGHSWGGKVMLQNALDDAAVDVVVVVDAPLGVRVFGTMREEIDRVLDAIAAVPMPVGSRKELVELLRGRGLSMGLAQWMTTNLDEQLRWKFDLTAIPEMLTSFGGLDLWPGLLAHRPSLAVHIVRGGRSDRWTADAGAVPAETTELGRLAAAVAAGVVVEHVLPAAGHWVHADDPEGLLRVLLTSALPDTTSQPP